MRISASYPATDGSCPESIEIEYPADSYPPADDVMRLIEALARVPGTRYALPGNAADLSRLSVEAHIRDRQQEFKERANG